MASRRALLKALGLAVGSAACLAFPADRVWAQVVKRLGIRVMPSAPAGILAPSDFTYLGMFKMPSGTFSEHALSNGVYTKGQIAGRTVSGTTTLIIAASNCAPGGQNGLGLVELSIPADGTLTTDINTAPHCTELRRWAPASQYGSIYEGTVHVPNEWPNPDNGYAIVLGLGHDGMHLTTVFGSNYGFVGEFPNLCKTLLNDNGTWTHYGPWASGNVQLFCGNPLALPASVQGLGFGTWGLCSAVFGSQAQSPRGSNWCTFTPPVYTAPPDTIGGPYSITKHTALMHNQGHPQARNTNAYACGPNVPNDVFDETIGNYPGGRWGPDPFEPYFGGVNGPDAVLNGSTTLDWIDSGVWIEGPSKTGVFFLGQLVETISIAAGFNEDRVYGGWRLTGGVPTQNSAWHINTDQAHAMYGTSICGHGHNMQSSAPGPGADSMIKWGFIYDPADLVDILNGDSPYGASPVYSFRGDVIGLNLERNVNYENAGIWWDAANKRLYVAQLSAYRVGFDSLPAIHVFSVDC